MDLEVQQLTPAGSGGVAVVELRGAGATQALRQVGIQGALEPGTLRLVRLMLRGSAEAASELPLDEGLLVVRSPEHVELHLHGSPALLGEVLEQWPKAQTAPRNVDTLERRAEALLPAAPSEAGARILLDQAGGALRRDLERLAQGPSPGVAGELAERGRVARRVLRRTRVLLVGPPNAGKSTLFNALVGEQRVLATPIPGTTRDAIHEAAWLGPWPLELIDTAGERDPGADGVEAAGQARARRLASHADWVLRLGAWGESGGGPDPDLWTHGERPGAPVQALRSVGDPAQARSRVRRAFEDRFALPPVPWSAGSGVPFEESQVQDLAAYAGGTQDGAWLQKRLALWLAQTA